MTAIESLSARPAMAVPTLETKVSASEVTSVANTSSGTPALAERTFSVEEYVAILRQAQSLQRAQAIKAEDERTNAVYAKLPAEEKDAQRVSMQSLYASATEIGVDTKTIDDAIAHYHPSTEQLNTAMSSLGGVTLTMKQMRDSALERLRTYQVIFVEELSSRLPDCKFDVVDKNSFFHHFLRNTPYPISMGGSGVYGAVAVHRPGKRNAAHIAMKLADDVDVFKTCTTPDTCTITLGDAAIAPAAILSVDKALERARLYHGTLKGITSYVKPPYIPGKVPYELMKNWSDIQRTISASITCTFDPKTLTR